MTEVLCPRCNHINQVEGLLLNVGGTLLFCSKCYIGLHVGIRQVVEIPLPKSLLTTGSTVTAAPVVLAEDDGDWAQPRVNPDR